MRKSIFFCLLLLTSCGGGSRPPQPPPQPTSTPLPEPTLEPTSQPTLEPTIAPTQQPTQQPTATPVPTVSIPLATPYPTPAINLADYIPARPAGRMATVSGPNLSQAIQAAQDDLEIASVHIEGGGSITRPPTLKKYTTFDSSTYSCDATDAHGFIQGVSVTDYGCFLVSDGVYVGGTYRAPQAVQDYFKFGNGRNYKDPYLLAVQALTEEQLAGTGTTILEPVYVNGGQPAVEVFQSLGDACCSHTGKAKNVTIQGFRIKGRQTIYDGGIRSTVLLGNCEHCAVVDVFLQDTASIGVTAGGSALETGNYAHDIVFTRNVYSGVAAANSATINTEDAYIFENYVRRPGHHEPKFGGGVCGHDHETNSPADHTKNVWLYNNLYDYEGAHVDGAGSAICLQDPYHGPNSGAMYAVNNVAIGGRDDRIHRYLTSGIYLVGIKGGVVANNYVFRTGQSAVQGYAIRNCLVQDNDLESTGGGGQYSVWTDGSIGTTFRRNHYRDRPGLGINTQAGFYEICGQNNIYENNLTNGENIANVAKEPCASEAPRGLLTQVVPKSNTWKVVLTVFLILVAAVIGYVIWKIRKRTTESKPQ